MAGRPELNGCLYRTRYPTLLQSLRSAHPSILNLPCRDTLRPVEK